jgi:hypothetical protein
MSKIIQLHTTKRRVWHALYFISLYDSDGMSESQAAQKLRGMAEMIEQRNNGLLVLGLDEDSLNVCDLP